MYRRSVILILPVVLCWILPLAAQAEVRIEMELATQPGFPITGAQTWQPFLTKAGVDGVRIRVAQGGEEPALDVYGEGEARTIKMLGILTAREELILPGGKFRKSDVARLKEFLATLRADGPEGLSQSKGAFGLSAKELAEAVEDLTRATEFPTLGEDPRRLVEQAASKTALPLSLDAAADAALAEAEPCGEDYQGLSLGTALAATLRPYGLMLQPRRRADKSLEHVVTVATPTSEAWPVGWPPQKKERELVPKLYEFLTVEIEGTPLPEALAAIQGRLEIPFLVDRNSLARHRIDLAAQAVSLPEGRTYYKKVLERILFQAKLKSELRVDEAGKPWLWITTIKP